MAELCDQRVIALQTGPFGSQLHASDYVDQVVPDVPTEVIQQRRIIHSLLPMVSATKANQLDRHRLHAGDILFARRGVQATGQTALVQPDEDGFLCGTGAIRLRIQQDGMILPEYLSHVLSSPSSVA